MNSVFLHLPGGIPFSLLNAKKIEDFEIENQKFKATVDAFGTYIFISNAFMCGVYPSATDVAHSEITVYVVSDGKPLYALYMNYSKGDGGISNTFEVKTPSEAEMEIDQNNLFTAPIMSSSYSGSYEEGGEQHTAFKIE